jgi:hypothetical protein
MNKGNLEEKKAQNCPHGRTPTNSQKFGFQQIPKRSGFQQTQKKVCIPAC